MIRREDWPEALHALVELRAGMPFAWGYHDCCAFAADAVKAMTGIDPMDDLRGYHSRETAEAILAEQGGLEAAVTARLGEPVGTAQARRGDVVLVDVANVSVLGICLGDFAAAPGHCGLVWYDRAFWRAAWRVG